MMIAAIAVSVVLRPSFAADLPKPVNCEQVLQTADDFKVRKERYEAMLSIAQSGRAITAAERRSALDFNREEARMLGQEYYPVCYAQSLLSNIGVPATPEIKNAIADNARSRMEDLAVERLELAAGDGCSDVVSVDAAMRWKTGGERLHYDGVIGAVAAGRPISASDQTWAIGQLTREAETLRDAAQCMNAPLPPNAGFDDELLRERATIGREQNEILRRLELTLISIRGARLAPGS